MILFESFGLFVLAALVGVPLVYGILLGTAGAIWINGLGHPLTTIFLSYIGGLESFVLIAVPLFMLAGEVLSSGGVGRRIVTFATTLLGLSARRPRHRHRGVMPDLRRRLRLGHRRHRCDRRRHDAGHDREGLLAAIRRSADVDGGHARGRDAAVHSDAGLRLRLRHVRCATCSWPAWCRPLSSPPVCRRCAYGPAAAPAATTAASARRQPRSGRHSSRRSRRLMMPVVILGGIWSGAFTPTEAAAVAAVYGLFVSMVIYRDLRLRDLPRLFLKSFTMSAVVMVVVGATSSLAWLITVEQVPAQLAGLVNHYATTQWMFLLLVNVCLLLLGCFIEPVPALILAAPLLVPLAAAFKIDLVHLGLIMTCNLAIGLYTPPVGGTLMVGMRLAAHRNARDSARADPAVRHQRDRAVRDHLCAVRGHGAGAGVPLIRPRLRCRAATQRGSEPRFTLIQTPQAQQAPTQGATRLRAKLSVSSDSACQKTSAMDEPRAYSLPLRQRQPCSHEDPQPHPCRGRAGLLSLGHARDQPAAPRPAAHHAEAAGAVGQGQADVRR